MSLGRGSLSFFSWLPFRQRLSEKGFEQRFDRRFGRYTKAKMGRKYHFGVP